MRDQFAQREEVARNAGRPQGQHREFQGPRLRAVQREHCRTRCGFEQGEAIGLAIEKDRKGLTGGEMLRHQCQHRFVAIEQQIGTPQLRQTRDQTRNDKN